MLLAPTGQRAEQQVCLLSFTFWTLIVQPSKATEGAPMNSNTCLVLQLRLTRMLA